MGFSATADALPADGAGGGDDRRVVRGGRLDPRRRDADRAAGHGAAAVRSAWAAWCSSRASSRSLSAVLGYWLSSERDVERRRRPARWPSSPAACTALAVLFSPQYGILSTLVRNLQTTLRILREDLLLMLYRVEEIDADEAPAAGRSRGGRRRRLARPLGAGDAPPPRPRRSSRRPAAHDRRRPLAGRPARPRAPAVGNVPGEAPRPAARPRPRAGRPRRALHPPAAPRASCKKPSTTRSKIRTAARFRNRNSPRRHRDHEETRSSCRSQSNFTCALVFSCLCTLWLINQPPQRLAD